MIRQTTGKHQIFICVDVVDTHNVHFLEYDDLQSDTRACDMSLDNNHLLQLRHFMGYLSHEGAFGWVDNEHDFITISNDRELCYALVKWQTKHSAVEPATLRPKHLAWDAERRPIIYAARTAAVLRDNIGFLVPCKMDNDTETHHGIATAADVDVHMAVESAGEEGKVRTLGVPVVPEERPNPLVTVEPLLRDTKFTVALSGDEVSSTTMDSESAAPREETPEDAKWKAFMSYYAPWAKEGGDRPLPWGDFTDEVRARMIERKILYSDTAAIRSYLLWLFKLPDGNKKAARFVGRTFQKAPLYGAVFEPLWGEQCLQQVSDLWSYAYTGASCDSYTPMEFPKDDPLMLTLYHKLCRAEVPIEGDKNVHAFIVRAIYLDDLRHYKWAEEKFDDVRAMFGTPLKYAYALGARRIFDYLKSQTSKVNTWRRGARSQLERIGFQGNPFDRVPLEKIVAMVLVDEPVNCAADFISAVVNNAPRPAPEQPTPLDERFERLRDVCFSHPSTKDFISYVWSYFWDLRVDHKTADYDRFRHVDRAVVWLYRHDFRIDDGRRLLEFLWKRHAFPFDDMWLFALEYPADVRCKFLEDMFKYSKRKCDAKMLTAMMERAKEYELFETAHFIYMSYRD